MSEILRQTSGISRQLTRISDEVIEQTELLLQIKQIIQNKTASSSIEKASVKIIVDGIVKVDQEYDIGSTPIIEFSGLTDALRSSIIYGDTSNQYAVTGYDVVLYRRSNGTWNDGLITGFATNAVSFTIPRGGITIEFTND